ncbi:MAG: MMPL family transporter, partial [Firmicutes bacterium]|nr:MMPL family transporter [Bacillota bacterium]
MSFLAGFVHRRPWIVMLTVIALTGLFIVGATRIKVSSGLREFYSQTDPRIRSLDRIDEAFGGSEYIMIAFLSERVFTVRGLQVLSDLSLALEELDGVGRVRSITNIAEVMGTPWGLEVSQMLDHVPDSEDEVEAFRARIAENGEISRALLSDGGDYVLTLVGLSPGADAGRVARLVQEVVGELAPGFSPHYAGGPVLAGAADEFLKIDLKKLFPVCAIVIVVVLFASFRTAAGVILPLVTVLLSVVWTMGLMGFVGIPLTQITSALPVVLLATGSAYGIHIMHRYYENRANGADGGAAANGAVKSTGIAIVLAGLTTVAGYSSNVASSIVRIREFGLLAGFGVGASLIIALAFVPSVLSIFRPARCRVGRRTDDCLGGGCPPEEMACASDVSFSPGAIGDHRRGVQKECLEAGRTPSLSWRASLFAGIGRLVARRGRAIGVIAAAVAVFAVAGIARITVDTNPVTFFPAGSAERRDFDLVRSKFGGVDTIQIMIDGDILDPATLSAIERIHDEFESVGGYGQALSVVSVLKQASRALHDNDPAWQRLPSTR